VTHATTERIPVVKDSELESKHLNLWKKGMLAAEQKNWDYVVSLVLPIVKDVPNFMDGRMLLRSAEVEVSGGAGKKRGLSFGGGGGLFKAGGKKDPWEQIADLEENVFQKDPMSAGANQQLYDLAMKLHFPELASLALETIRRGQPDNTKNLHKLAKHYMAFEEPEKAGEIYAAALKVNPQDMEARKGEQDAAARTSIIRQGWQGGSFQDAVKDKGEAAKLEMLSKQGMTKEQMEEFLAETIEQYNADNTNLVLVKRMADLYERLDDLGNAHAFFQYALDLNPADVAMQRKVEQVRDKVQDRELQQMEAEIAANPEAPEAAEKQAKVDAIRQERAQQLVGEAKNRAERNPTDKTLRFELGQAYFNAGMHTEAIPELQQAKSNPHIRTKAMLMLGRCFEKKNMNDLAQSALAEAVAELTVMDNTKKEILYELALVHEKSGQTEEYLTALKEIYNADYGYRDVAKRVESSYS
jgi:tetratricopeptide (TPR) repeat protein